MAGTAPHPPTGDSTPASAGVTVENTLLRITDLVTGRHMAVRMEPGESGLAVGEMLDRYVKHADVAALLAQRRITDESVDALHATQDYVYRCSDDGTLGDMYPGLVLRQDERLLEPDEVPHGVSLESEGRDVLLFDIEIDRESVGYDRNWRGFHRRRWDLYPNQHGAFVSGCLEAQYGPAGADDVLQLNSPGSKLKLVEAVARRIWTSDFENYSRFMGRKLVYKTGDETVRNIMDGAGGICSEKVQALKFVTDRYGIESEYLIAGPDVPGPVPEAQLREMLTTFDFRFTRRHMRYWQHAALLFNIDGEAALVDATNGNIPFVFERNEAAERLLGYENKQALHVRMALSPEDFYYHRVPQDIPEDLYFAMEGWIPDVDLVQVFDNELGLCITNGFMVAPLVYRSDRALERLRRQYLAAAGQAGVECVVDAEWSLESEIGRRFTAAHEAVADRVLACKEHLLTRYNDCHGPGHEAGLVVMALGPASDTRIARPEPVEGQC